MESLPYRIMVWALFWALGTFAPASDELGKDVFDGPGLRLRIELPAEVVAQLRKEPRTFVKGTVREGETVYRDVGVRLKGFLGSFRPIDQKAGFSLKFNQFDPKQRFHGLRKVLLNNSVQDSTYLSECLAGELFRAAGVPAPRVGFAVVELNGQKLGLYTVVEPINRDFLTRWFKDSSGNLYEGPGDIHTDRLATVSNGHTSDRKDLRALAEAAREPELTARLERLEKVLDLDRFLSFLAMEAITAHWDGYTTGVNNYHLYHDPQMERMVFMPHGTDQLFQNVNAPMMLQANGLVAKSVFKVSAGKRRYRERLRDLLDRVLDVPAIQRRITELEAKVRPLLMEQGPGALLGHALSVRSLSYRIGERAKSLRDQLEGKSVPAAPGALGAAGRPLAFDENGRARITGWQSRAFGGRPEFKRSQGEGEKGGMALVISIPEGWRVPGLLAEKGVPPPRTLPALGPDPGQRCGTGDPDAARRRPERGGRAHFGGPAEEETPRRGGLDDLRVHLRDRAGRGPARRAAGDAGGTRLRTPGLAWRRLVRRGLPGTGPHPPKAPLKTGTVRISPLFFSEK